MASLASTSGGRPKREGRGSFLCEHKRVFSREQQDQRGGAFDGGGAINGFSALNKCGRVRWDGRDAIDDARPHLRMGSVGGALWWRRFSRKPISPGFFLSTSSSRSFKTRLED